jgi:hypothetical protein
LADTEAQSKMERTVKEKKIQKKYEEEFKRQAVELVAKVVTGVKFVDGEEQTQQAA